MRSAEELLTDLAEVVRQTFPDRDFPEPVELSTRVFGDLGLADEAHEPPEVAYVDFAARNGPPP